MLPTEQRDRIINSSRTIELGKFQEFPIEETGALVEMVDVARLTMDINKAAATKDWHYTVLCGHRKITVSCRRNIDIQ